MTESPRQRTVEKASAETMARFQDIAGTLIMDKVEELGGKDIVGHVTPDDLADAIKSLGLTPANDRMSDEDMRELLALGSSITNAASMIVQIRQHEM